MRKLLLIAFIFLISINIVNSGKIYRLDFSNDLTHKLTISERDMIRFMFPVREYLEPELVGDKEVINYNIIDKEHAVMVRKVNEGKQYVDLTFFIKDAETPFYQAIDKKIVMNIDFERDELTDLRVGLDKIDGDNVTLVFKAIDNTNKEPNLDFIERNNLFKKKEKVFDKITSISTFSKVSLIISLIILVLILAFIVNSRFIRKKYRKIRKIFL